MGSLTDGEALKREGWYHDLPASDLFNVTVRNLFEEYSHIEPSNVLPHLLSIVSQIKLLHVGILVLISSI